jgi:hypothetical protein
LDILQRKEKKEGEIAESGCVLAGICDILTVNEGKEGRRADEI